MKLTATWAPYYMLSPVFYRVEAGIFTCFSAKLHIALVNCMWNFLTLVFQQIKNQLWQKSNSLRKLSKTGNKTTPKVTLTKGVKLDSNDGAHQSTLRNRMAEKHRLI